jgi:hypothetical protein
MVLIPYDDACRLLRVYQDWECDEEGYPFIWPQISLLMRRDAQNRCSDCGIAYHEAGDRLTVHHLNTVKADCQWMNLFVACWLCHTADHQPSFSNRDIYCRRCKGWFNGWKRFQRHTQGMHPSFYHRKTKSGLPGSSPRQADIS